MTTDEASFLGVEEERENWRVGDLGVGGLERVKKEKRLAMDETAISEFGRRLCH